MLRDFNPSFEQLAEIMRDLADIVYDLTHENDPLLAQKALDYVEIMHKMALAIVNEDDVRLSDLVKELDKKPFM